MILAVPVAVFSCGGGGGPGTSSGTGGQGSGGSAMGSGGRTGSGGTSVGSGGTVAPGSGGNNDAGGNDTASGSGGAPDGGDSDVSGTGGAMTSTGQLFGSHKFQYPAGTIKPTGVTDSAVSAFYDRWKTAYLRQACGGYYVFTGGGTGAEPGTVEVSEGHGYGMAIVPYMAGYDPNAQKIFDGLYTVFRKAPSINNPDLMSWSIREGCVVPNGANDFADSATDGDLDIAFGLVAADRQWGSAGTINYLAEAKKVIAAIKAHEINPTTSILMLGDWADIKAPYYAGRYTDGVGPYGTQPHSAFYFGTRPSDFMLDHLRAFGRATGDAAWMTIVDAHHTLIKKMQDQYASATGLLPDFIEQTNTTPKPVGENYLEAVSDGRVGYNSCRVPWHLATDYIVSGDARAKAEVDRINRWVKGATNSNPANIKDGYALSGTATGTAKNLAFEAPLGVAAIVDVTNQAWLDALWTDMVTRTTGTTDYYGDSIKMLSILIISGNWWQP
jgi:endo-1,4-beta-D-glucanase Y